MERYDPDTDAWTDMPAMPRIDDFSVGPLGGAALGDKAYLFGNAYTRAAYSYDLATGEMRRIASSSQYERLSVVAWKGRLVLVGDLSQFVDHPENLFHGWKKVGEIHAPE